MRSRDDRAHARGSLEGREARRQRPTRVPEGRRHGDGSLGRRRPRGDHDAGGAGFDLAGRCVHDRGSLRGRPGRRRQSARRGASVGARPSAWAAASASAALPDRGDGDAPQAVRLAAPGLELRGRGRRAGRRRRRPHRCSEPCRRAPRRAEGAARARPPCEPRPRGATSSAATGVRRAARTASTTRRHVRGRIDERAQSPPVPASDGGHFDSAGRESSLDERGQRHARERAAIGRDPRGRDRHRDRPLRVALAGDDRQGRPAAAGAPGRERAPGVEGPTRAWRVRAAPERGEQRPRGRSRAGWRRLSPIIPGRRRTSPRPWTGRTRRARASARAPGSAASSSASRSSPTASNDAPRRRSRACCASSRASGP